MRYSYRLLVCNVLLAWSLTGCSTPGSRAREHAAAFGRLAPADQQLARHGRIRPGMSAEGVYVAWGEPDAKTAGGEGGKSRTETWIYRQRVTFSEPMNSYGFNGPYHGFGDSDAGRGFLPPYAYGGIGYESVLKYQPRVRSLDAVRIAEFKGGQVDRYKSAEGDWQLAAHPAVALASTPSSPQANARPSSVNRSSVALTTAMPARRLPHLAHRPAKSTHLAAVYHRKNALARHLSAGGNVHRQHPALHAGTGKTGGSKPGVLHQSTHNLHGGHGWPHGSGHAHPGAAGKVRTSSA